MPPYKLASDKLLARKSFAYAEDKLHYVQQMQSIFATGMKNLWPELTYIDILAGPGRCIIEETGREFPGSPVLSLDAPFTKRIFVESDPPLVSALRQRVPTDCIVLEGSCSDPHVISEIRKHTGRGLGLMFVDNLGMTVPFSTIEELTAGRRCDLLIVFQLQDPTRNSEAVTLGVDDPERWTKFFGTDAWQNVVGDLRSMNSRASEITAALEDLYVKQLGTIGYPHVARGRDVIKNSRNAPMYRLMLASRHPLGEEFFKKIERMNAQRQRRLLE